MATTKLNGSKNGAPATTHPNVQLWDKLYKENKDEWTSHTVDSELMKFHEMFTDGKTGLDILVPMCGRSKVMLTLAESGHRVVGIEWSEPGVKLFFEDNELKYTTKLYDVGGIEMPVYCASDKPITIYCGNLFAFKEDNLGGFDCIFDHGSIGSFDFKEVTRATYAGLMKSFTKPGGRILLSIFDYDHSEHPTIPFAATEKEVVSLYQKSFPNPKLIKEFDTSQATNLFSLGPGTLFPVWTFSHFAWKIILLTKQYM